MADFWTVPKKGKVYRQDTTTSSTSTIETLTSQNALDRLKSDEFFIRAKRWYKFAEPRKNLTLDYSLGKQDWDAMNHADLMEHFYHDRSYASYNTVGIADELQDVYSATPEQLEDYKYLQDTWNALPSFWDDPNRKLLGQDNTMGAFGDWLMDAGGALLFDPVNLVGFGAGKAAGVTVMSTALKELLKNKMAKQINSTMLNNVAKTTVREGVKTGAMNGAIKEGAYAGVIGMVHSSGVQIAQIKGGVQEEFDYKQMGYGALAGTAFGGAFGAAFGAGGFLLTQNTIRNTAIKNLASLHKYGMDDLTGRRLFDNLMGQVTKKGKVVIPRGSHNVDDFYKNMSPEDKGKHVQLSKIESENQSLIQQIDYRTRVENGTVELKARTEKTATDEDRALASKLSKKLKKELKENPDGFTFDAKTFRKVKDGNISAVSKKTEYEIGEDNIDSDILNFVLDMKAYEGLFDEILPGLKINVGGWGNNKTKTVSLDVSFAFKDEADAIYAATAGLNVQDAIAKLSKGEYLGDIQIGKDGKLLPDGGLAKLKASGKYDKARHDMFKKAVKNFEDRPDDEFYNPQLHIDKIKKKTKKELSIANSDDSPINFDTQAYQDRTLDEHVDFLKTVASKMGDFDIAKISDEELKSIALDRWADDWPGVKELLEKQIKTPVERQIMTLLLAHDNHTLTLVDDILNVSNKLNSINLTLKEQNSIMFRMDGMMKRLNEALQIRAQIGYLAGRTLQSFQTKRSINEATKMDVAKLLKERLGETAEDLVLPEGSDAARLNKLEFYKSISKLNDADEVQKALIKAKQANSWDLANEYVNNNLLSSPDTHELNIMSSLANMHWKPAVKLISSLFYTGAEKGRAGQMAREAIQTLGMSYYYMFSGTRAALKTFHKGRPILDEYQNKVDGSVRQGMLQNWANLWIDTMLGNYSITAIPRAILKGGVAAVTAPLRVLSAGDEFLKVTSFKAKAHSQVTTLIQREHPEVMGDRKAYHELHKKYMKNYLTDDGHAISAENVAHAHKLTVAEKAEVGDPLHYAREVSYTNPATSTDPVPKGTKLHKDDRTLTGGDLGAGDRSGITGAILSMANRHKWMRLLGLHFINTPGNLIRWQMQHSPLGLSKHTRHFQLDFMLRKNKDGSYINPEAAAEANARITAGSLLWGAAIMAAMYGKVTGGGSRDYKINKQRQATTGWQQYSHNNGNGKFTSLNRADPFAFPFLIAADIVEIIDDYNGVDEMPFEVKQAVQEASSGVLTSIMRNLTSKFYTVGIYEMVDVLLGTGQQQWSNPERKLETVTARFGQKFIPLNGLLKYSAKVQDPYERDMITLQNKLWDQSNAFEGRNSIMPLRNIFGNKVDRRRGWMFGFDIPSSPFASSESKHPEVLKFFEESGRDYNLKNPSHIDKLTAVTANDKGVDLKLLKNDKGQTAYDRWMEIKSELRIHHSGIGKKASLEEIFVYEITNPNSKMNKQIQITGGKVEILGTDYKQNYLAKWVKGFNDLAYVKMWKEFPELEQVTLTKQKYVIKMFDNAPQSTIKDIQKDAVELIKILNKKRY